MIVSFSSRIFNFSNAGGHYHYLIMLLYYIKQGIFMFLVKAKSYWCIPLTSIDHLYSYRDLCNELQWHNFHYATRTHLSVFVMEQWIDT